MSETASPLLIGAVAVRLGCREWQIDRLIKRKLIPEPGRCGRFRTFVEEDLPTIRRALVDAGYIVATTPARTSR
jgi:hypothetical protein